jgi:uncharacterized protein (TIGR01777 family)
MKIVIPGGTGQVGGILCRALSAAGHEVVVLSRAANRRAAIHPNAPWRIAAWDGRTPGEWARELAGTDVLINLAGRSVNCRYNAANRRAILDSRVKSTQVLGRALAECARPPRTWLQASTATIYAHRYDAPNDEATGILGGSEPNAPDTWQFSVDVAIAWERAANEAAADSRLRSVRLVLMRSAMTMSPDRGGVFDTLLRLVRFGLGGRVGDGRQYVSWIHDRDFLRAIDWLIEHEELSGPVNLASPNPLPYAEFMHDLRDACGAPIGLPATRWMLEIGTFLMRTESELVLKSRRVVPTRLLESAFAFQFPAWPEAAGDLCRRWRNSRQMQVVTAHA